MTMGSRQGFETVPETGRQRPTLQYSEAQMAKLGADAYREMTAKFAVIKTGSKAELVQSVARRVATASGKDCDWEFKPLDAADRVNAFCLPGGKIAVFSGVLPLTAGEARLAVVISHEVAHATLQHGNERLSQPRLKRIIGAPVGLRYLKKAGFDVNEAPRFWRRMAAASPNETSDSLSTHPDAEQRANRLEKRIREMR